MKDPTITLPRATIRDDGKRITITHRNTGVVIEVPRSKLDTWAISQLRAMISLPPTK